MNLNQVTLPAVDVEASVAFYQGLGLKLIVSSPQYARFECPGGDSTLSVHQAEGPVAATAAVVCFECADLDDKIASLQGRAYSFTQMPTDRPWLWREARLKDPAGNEICLYWAGENRKNPPWRVRDSEAAPATRPDPEG